MKEQIKWLREFLVNEFALGPDGLGNPVIDGFYLDDSWHTAPKVPTTAPWGGCNLSPVGGATEENGYCSEDMGLSAADVADIHSNWCVTGSVSSPAAVCCQLHLYLFQRASFCATDCC